MKVLQWLNYNQRIDNNEKTTEQVNTLTDDVEETTDHVEETTSNAVETISRIKEGTDTVKVVEEIINYFNQENKTRETSLLKQSTLLTFIVLSIFFIFYS